MEKSINTKLIYGILAISIMLNVIVLCILLLGKSNNKETNRAENQIEEKEQLTEKAKLKIKEHICSNLYIPDSYDPVETRIDSAFHYYMTDFNCVKAGEELIKDRVDYNNSKRGYEEALNNIKTFGGSGVFRRYSVERDDCRKNMEESKAKIEKNELIIKNRDKTHDGEFVGWFVYNKYRAKNNNNTVNFGESLVLYDKNLDQWLISYNIDKNSTANFDEVRKVIEELLDE